MTILFIRFLWFGEPLPSVNILLTVSLPVIKQVSDPPVEKPIRPPFAFPLTAFFLQSGSTVPASFKRYSLNCSGLKFLFLTIFKALFSNPFKASSAVRGPPPYTVPSLPMRLAPIFFNSKLSSGDKDPVLFNLLSNLIISWLSIRLII